MRHLQANEILQLFDSHEHGLKRRISKEASIKETLLALHQADTPLQRIVLCDILGERGSKSAVPTLIDYLDDPLPKIQKAAAEALGKIGDPRAGETLFAHFEQDEVEELVRLNLALGLGGVQYRPAIPALIQALSSDDKRLRSCAAWSLGRLHAKEAEDALTQALAKETYGYGALQMEEALSKIKQT